MRQTPTLRPKPDVVLAVLVVAALLFGSGRPALAQDARDPGAALRDGTAFAMMRHAIAPGTGDPDHFTLGDCATQRNLSEAGRRQAAEIGARFREYGIAGAQVFSSEWCRCIDTAKLLDLGPVETLAPLNSFFGNYKQRDPQTAALRAWLAAFEAAQPLILVTHQVNIRALTGVHTRSGEIVVVRREADGTMTVLGSL